MLTVSTPDLDLIETWVDSESHRPPVRVTFPINALTGAEDSAIVYFEVAPGGVLATHTDSAEEILYIVSGEAEGHVGDEVGRVRAGDLVLIPAMAPHGLRNVGDDTVRVVGFFSENVVTSTFEEPLLPIGQAALVQGAPVPA
jgi:quercetin dioxygenase-like cupin family protein